MKHYGELTQLKDFLQQLPTGIKETFFFFLYFVACDGLTHIYIQFIMEIKSRTTEATVEHGLTNYSYVE